MPLHAALGRMCQTNYMEPDKLIGGAMAGAAAIIGALVKRMMSANDKKIEDLQASINDISEALTEFSSDAQEILSDMRVSIAEMGVERLKEDIEKLENRQDRMFESIQQLQLLAAKKRP